MPSFGAACQLWIKKGIVGECQLTNAESRNQIRYDTSAEGLYGFSCRGVFGVAAKQKWALLGVARFRQFSHSNKGHAQGDEGCDDEG